MLKIPSVGSTIRVTTRFRNTYYFSDSEWNDITSTGVVMQINGDSFKLKTDNKEFPVSIIPIKRIIDISVISGKMSTVRKFKVTGSKEYIVTLSDNSFSCECVGFKYHGKCRHVTKVKDKLGMK